MRRFPACDAPKDIGPQATPQGSIREIREYFVNPLATTRESASRLDSLSPRYFAHQRRVVFLVRCRPLKRYTMQCLQVGRTNQNFPQLTGHLSGIIQERNLRFHSP